MTNCKCSPATSNHRARWVRFVAITPACTCTFLCGLLSLFRMQCIMARVLVRGNSKFKPFPIFQRSCKRTISSRSLINARTKAQLRVKRRATRGRKREWGVSLPFYQAKGANIRTMNWDKLWSRSGRDALMRCASLFLPFSHPALSLSLSRVLERMHRTGGVMGNALLFTFFPPISRNSHQLSGLGIQFTKFTKSNQIN